MIALSVKGRWVSSSTASLGSASLLNDLDSVERLFAKALDDPHGDATLSHLLLLLRK